MISEKRKCGMLTKRTYSEVRRQRQKTWKSGNVELENMLAFNDHLAALTKMIILIKG